MTTAIIVLAAPLILGIVVIAMFSAKTDEEKRKENYSKLQQQKC